MKNAAPRPGHGNASRPCVRIAIRKLPCKIENPLPVLPAFNPQDDLHQFQTLENRGRAGRARLGRAQSYDVWREVSSLAFHVLLRAQQQRPAFALSSARRREKILDVRSE